MRIAKFISHSGFCSRRNAEELILAEKVKINGQTIFSPVHFVNNNDQVEVNGTILTTLSPKIWIYYKPTEVITSHKDHRKTVFKEVKHYIKEHVISIGRLDYMSEGLLLLTNSPEIAYFFENPENCIKRTYLVITQSDFSEKIQKTLQNGIKIHDIQYQNIKTNIINSDEKKITQYKHFFDNFYDRKMVNKLYNNEIIAIEFILTEGKNREIRNIFDYFQMKIIKLIRYSYGDFSINNISTNQIKTVKNSVTKKIYNTIKKTQDSMPNH